MDKHKKDQNNGEEENSSVENENEAFIPLEIPSENESEDTTEEDEVQQASDASAEEIAKLNDIILRERAEFVNYRKRINQENLQQEGRIAGKILQEMVPVFDAFDLLLVSEHEGEKSMEKFLEGSKLIRKQLWQVFENLGVETIDPDQLEFDPTTMEALSVSESEAVDREIVKQVYQKGYKYKDRILRPARVAVEKPKSPGK